MSIIQFIKGLIPGAQPNNDAEFDTISRKLLAELRKANRDFWRDKPFETEVYKNEIVSLSDDKKVAFIVYCAQTIHHYYKQSTSYSSADTKYQKIVLLENILRHLLRCKLKVTEDDVELIAETFINYSFRSYGNLLHWPVVSLIIQVEKNFQGSLLPEKVKKSLVTLHERLLHLKDYYDQKEQVKLIGKIDAMLFKADNEASVIRPVYFPVSDAFSAFANEMLEKTPPDQQTNWFQLMALAQKSSSAKPSQKFLDTAKELFTAIIADRFKRMVQEWFQFITQFKETVHQHTQNYNGTDYTYTSHEFLSAANLDVVKAFVWICVHFHDKTTLFTIANLADRCYRKIPGKGPAAAGLGNACLYTLANSKGLDGISHLSRLRLRIKQASTQATIEKYLTEAAEKHNVSVHEIEDMAVDDYGFENEKKTYAFDDYKAEITITGVGKTITEWYKPDGSLQKSVPAFVTAKYAAKLKKLKETVKQVELQLTAQRDRVDRMLKADRRLTTEHFNQCYFKHGVVSFLAKGILWDVVMDNVRTSIFYKDNYWVNSSSGIVFNEIPDGSLITLWHPVFHSIDEVKAWREFMIANEISQPLKQAFREVYFLTDAEINTSTYSNRMAAHILKQHQFNSLAKTRGWKYSLMGAFDNGIESGTASILLKDYDLKAEFWINEVNEDGATNDTGIWNYVATDQVRFIKVSTAAVMELIYVPALVFSEILRDVDLFVGVASVGNDPMWRDNGGLPAYRDYWQSYSFGDLNQIAKSRKETLERLVPRLKIAPVATIKDKFLVVKGKLRTYKIHIGSTNILMEPNDQYLCIVPDRGAKQASDNLFIPFEGDNGLSVIISKALLLADDDKIKDSTITSQINRR